MQTLHCALLLPPESQLHAPRHKGKSWAGNNLFFPTERTPLPLLSCLAQLRRPPATLSGFPTRTPVPNLISKCFEGNSCACKLADVVSPGGYALVLASSGVVNESYNRVSFTAEADSFIN